MPRTKAGTRSLENGTQIRIVVPPHLYAPLWQEAKDAGVTMADLVRLAILERYKDKVKTLQPPQKETVPQ